MNQPSFDIALGGDVVINVTKLARHCEPARTLVWQSRSVYGIPTPVCELARNDVFLN